MAFKKCHAKVKNELGLGNSFRYCLAINVFFLKNLPRYVYIITPQ